jgi:hypothetical protein
MVNSNARCRSIFFKRFCQKSVGFGGFCALEGGIVAVGGEKDDGDVVLGLQHLGQGDAVHAAFLIDVEQSDVWAIFLYLEEGFFGTGKDARDLVAEFAEEQGDLRANNHFVFDDQYFDGLVGHAAFFKLKSK